MAADPVVPSSRRTILAAALGGLAASVAGALGRPAPTNAAAGDPLTLGVANNSGTAQTTLTNSGLGAAFTLKTTNIATGATGIFGWSSSTSSYATRGVYGRVDGPNSNAVVGIQTGAAGTGAAVRAEGGNNVGVVATTTNSSQYAVSATNAGVSSGAGAAIMASGGSKPGLIVTSDTEDAIRATSTSSYALWATSTSNYAIVANSTSGHGIYGSTASTSGTATGGYAGAATGTTNGIYGQSVSTGGRGVYGWASAATGTTYGVYGEADSTGGRGVRGNATAATGGAYGVYGTTASNTGIGTRGWASHASGATYGLYGSTVSAAGYGVLSGSDALVSGDLTVIGAKTGYVADLAFNGGSSTLRQGDVVTLVGARPAVLGSIPVLVVRAAERGDPVIGVVDRVANVSRQSDPGSEDGGTLPHVKGGGTTVKAGEHLLVVTLGAFAAATVDATGGAIKAGDRLSPGPRAGRLSKAAAVDVGGRKMHAAGEQVGYALGELAEGSGKIAIFVNPH